jgi:hypothetical protein
VDDVQRLVQVGDDDRGGASVEHTGDATPMPTVRR